jgi:hypothetical protein
MEADKERQAAAQGDLETATDALERQRVATHGLERAVSELESQVSARTCVTVHLHPAARPPFKRGT